FSGPGTITGRLDFSAGNTGQYHNTNGANVGPTSVNYGVTDVTAALNTINSLSSSLAGLGSSLAINGTQTVNESDGQLVTVISLTSASFDGRVFGGGSADMHDSGPGILIAPTTTGTPPPSSKTWVAVGPVWEGLSPAYWQSQQTFSAWTTYSTTSSFDAVFGV